MDCFGLRPRNDETRIMHVIARSVSDEAIHNS